MEFHETQFRIEHVLFHTTCSMKRFPMYQTLTDMWPMKITGMGSWNSKAEINAKKSKLDKEWTTDEVDTLIHHYMRAVQI